MKNTIKILLLCATFLFAYPNEITAQKKRKVVKRHIKKHHKVTKKRIKHLTGHRYKHLPRRGKVIKKLGTGAVSLNFKGAKVFYHNGVWYRPSKTKHNQYIVSKAPIGIFIKMHKIPWLGRPRIIVDQKVYYYYYGTFYEDKAGSEEFTVVNAPIGAKVDALPEGYDTVEINDITYYKFDDVHYTFIDNGDNDAYFIVTKVP